METLATGRSKRQTSHEFYKGLYKLTGARGVAFWITNFVISLSPTAPEYRAAFSISYHPMALVEALVGGLISCRVYRLWRDGGYALGALLSGFLFDTLGISFAILTIAALTFISGIIVATVMYETLPAPQVTKAGATTGDYSCERVSARSGR